MRPALIAAALIVATPALAADKEYELCTLAKWEPKICQQRIIDSLTKQNEHLYDKGTEIARQTIIFCKRTDLPRSSRERYCKDI